jgi:hypothetical protein
MTIYRGKEVWWPDNIEPQTGGHTLLLPGEIHVSRDEMRRRTAEYYRQIRGKHFKMKHTTGVAERELGKIKALLGSDPNHPD